MNTVLITGVSKGIGLALANKFLEMGFEVIGTVLSGSFPEDNKPITIFNLDLSSPESIANCVKKIIDSGKKIDILINNAGVLFDEEETNVVVEKLHKTLQVNLVGTIDFTEHIIPIINPNGHIINISSTAGSLDRAGRAESHFPNHYPCYKISKAALNMYTRTLAIRLKDSNITVSSLHPGWVRTDMGGPDADISPEESAENIYTFSLSRPETGEFWFNGKKLEW